MEWERRGKGRKRDWPWVKRCPSTAGLSQELFLAFFWKSSAFPGAREGRRRQLLGASGGGFPIQSSGSGARQGSGCGRAASGSCQDKQRRSGLPGNSTPGMCEGGREAPPAPRAAPKSPVLTSQKIPGARVPNNSRCSHPKFPVLPSQIIPSAPIPNSRCSHPKSPGAHTPLAPGIWVRMGGMQIPRETLVIQHQNWKFSRNLLWINREKGNEEEGKRSGMFSQAFLLCLCVPSGAAVQHHSQSQIIPGNSSLIPALCTRSWWGLSVLRIPT